MKDFYEDLGSIMGELKADKEILKVMILNGRNMKANFYLREAVQEIDRALSDLSYALFDITTSPDEEDGSDDFEMEIEKGLQANQEPRMALAAVNDCKEAKLFSEEYDIPYKEITRGKDKGKLRILPLRTIDHERAYEVHKKLRKSRLSDIIDHESIFRDRNDNTIVTFSPYDVTERPKNRPWLEMSEHSIYGYETKTFVVRCEG